MRTAVKKARAKRADKTVVSAPAPAPAPAPSPKPDAQPGRCSVRACPYPAVIEGLCRSHDADKNTVEASAQKSSLPEYQRADSPGSHHSAGWRKSSPRHEKRDHSLF